MWDYTPKVMEHFLHPRNVGEIADADGVGEVGNITCGDALKLFLKLDAAKARIVDVKFQTFGCASAIASASALTELVVGKTLAEAEKITNQDIAHFLGELPEEKMHCSVMGMEALQAAIANFRGTSDGKVTEGEHAVGETYDPKGLDRVVCICFNVTERKIHDVVKANDLRTVDDVTHYCKAGGGCGGCKDKIAAVIESVRGEMAGQQAALAEGAARPAVLTNVRKMRMIEEVLDRDIRPALQSDGGDVELIDIDGNRVVVRLKGACAGCPGAHMTIKRYVEARLREKVLPDLVVEEQQ